MNTTSIFANAESTASDELLGKASCVETWWAVWGAVEAVGDGIVVGVGKLHVGVMVSKVCITVEGAASERWLSVSQGGHYDPRGSHNDSVPMFVLLLSGATDTPSASSTSFELLLPVFALLLVLCDDDNLDHFLSCSVFAHSMFAKTWSAFQWNEQRVNSGCSHSICLSAAATHLEN